MPFIIQVKGPRRKKIRESLYYVFWASVCYLNNLGDLGTS